MVIIIDISSLFLKRNLLRLILIQFIKIVILLFRFTPFHMEDICFLRFRKSTSLPSHPIIFLIISVRILKVVLVWLVPELVILLQFLSMLFFRIELYDIALPLIGCTITSNIICCLLSVILLILRELSLSFHLKLTFQFNYIYNINYFIFSTFHMFKLNYTFFSTCHTFSQNYTLSYAKLHTF